MFDFELAVNRSGIGNMKGIWMEGAKDKILLSGAEMDYPTAPCVIKALSSFSERGIFGYTLPDEGYLEHICWWMEHVRGATISREYIAPSYGTIMGLSVAIRAFTGEGDGIIIQHPSYNHFDHAVVLNRRRVISNPFIYDDEGRYSLDVEDLEEKMSDPGNRMMILCNPHNPTGHVMAEWELREIVRLAGKYNITVFSDEIFAENVHSGDAVPIYSMLDPAHGVSSTSLGKSFNLTGVSQANLIIPDARLRERWLEQRNSDHFGSIDPFFYTALCAAYTEEGQEWVRAMNAHTVKNYELLKETLSPFSPRVRLSPLEGTFVAWLDARGTGLKGDELYSYIRNNAGVIADNGVNYGPGGDGFLRMNIATPAENMRAAAERLAAAFSELL